MQINHKGRKDYADRVVKIKSPNNEEYVKAVVICVLGWKYLDEQDDLSYPRFNEIKKRLDRVEKTINADQPYGGIFNEFGFDAKDNENGGRS